MDNPFTEYSIRLHPTKHWMELKKYFMNVHFVNYKHNMLKQIFIYFTYFVLTI